MDTKNPTELGKEVGGRLWHTARVKKFLGDPPRRFRLVQPSLAAYIDRRLNRLDLPDPLPPITGNDPGSIVWGQRTWDLPIGPSEARSAPVRTIPDDPRRYTDREAAWIRAYRAVKAACTVGLYFVGAPGQHIPRPAGGPVQITEDSTVMMELEHDVVAVCSARPLSEDEHGRVPSFLADVVDAVLVTIHRRAVDRQIARARSMYEHAPVTPAVDQTTGEVQNLDSLKAAA